MGFVDALRTAWGWLKSNTWAVFAAVVGVLSILLGVERWRRKREERRRRRAESRADASEGVEAAGREARETEREAREERDAKVVAIDRRDAEEEARIEAVRDKVEEAASAGDDELAELANEHFGNPPDGAE